MGVETNSTRPQETSVARNKKPLSGFPWIPSLLVYSISWGWSLLRPNTLYWDDWAYIFNRPKSYLNEIFVDTGLPPWRALIDQELLSVGYWTIRWLTFVMFFAAGIFLFEILKKLPILSSTQRSYIVLLFLVIPVNHARISLVMFGYTTSYFLFFLGWMLLIRRSNLIHFLTASFCFFWCFMTHSFLFFVVLPIAHFIFLNRRHLIRSQKDFRSIGKTLFLLLLPIIYFAIRHRFWQPTEEFDWYHKIYIGGSLVGATHMLPSLILASYILYKKNKRSVSSNALICTCIGLFTFGIGLFPYFSAALLSRNSIFQWNMQWNSRNGLLAPLGVAASLVSLTFLMSRKWANQILILFLILSVSLNAFWGAQYFLDSVKKAQIVNILSDNQKLLSGYDLVFIDEAQRFNGRGSVYRKTEIQGLLSVAGVSSTSVISTSACEATAGVNELVIKSNKNFISALLTQDLGLFAEINLCEIK